MSPSPGVDSPLRLATVPLGLWHTAARSPTACAVVEGDLRLSYGELAAHADHVAEALTRRGAVPGDRVAVLATPSASLVALIHAATRLGLALSPINTRLRPSDVAALVQRLEPCLVVADDENRDLAGAGEGALIPLGDLVGHFVPPSPNVSSFPSQSRPATSIPGRAMSVPADTPWTIVFSSGTTDRPKGVVLTAGNHVASALASALRLGVLPQDEWLLALPLYHVGGLSILFRSALYGTAVRLLPRFDEDDTLRRLVDGDVSHVSLVPTMLRRLAEAWDDADRPALHPRLRVILLGGAAADTATVAQLRRAGWPVIQTYGLSETASQVATEFLPGPLAAGMHGDGEPSRAVPLPFVDLRVVDEAGREAPPGELGEICVRGPVVMPGYWRDPDATAAVLVDGWLHTGDAGWLSSGGSLTVADRRDDLIITGGENVSPREVEAVLARHDAVLACCVVGEPDEEWGARLVAVVVPEASVDETNRDRLEAEILSHASANLARFKCPRRVVWADALPLTANGKVRRRVVREWVAAGADGELSAFEAAGPQSAAAS